MRILIVSFCFYLIGLHAVAGHEYRGNTINMENEFISLSFDAGTGALTAMINKKTGDNYLKNPKAGNLFRLYANTTAMAKLSAGPHNENNGGNIIEPANCVLKDHAIRKDDLATVLELAVISPDRSLAIKLTIVLEKGRTYFDCYLKVQNNSSRPSNIYAAIPYLSGVTLGTKPSDNLAVNMWDRGYPGIKAWQQNSGGVYGREVSMQWQCVYEPALEEGLAFITLDTAFSNKILTCFPGGGMQALYFDRKHLAPGKEVGWSAARIAVFNGSWRTAAKLYKAWCADNLGARPVPAWYKNEVAIRGSAWIPNREAVQQAKESGQKERFTSFEQLPLLYRGGYADCLEMAMWNEEVNLFPETYGPWMSSGLLDFRSDLGGKTAFEAGVKKVHQYGRKVAMYVAGYGIRTSSPLFKKEDWKNWAIVNNEKGEINFGYRGEKDTEIYGIFNCVGYKPWQDNIIRVCTMLAKAGIDEIRLDEIGFPFKPCFNKVHQHDSPYDSHRWTREFLRRIREALDRINPELVISTEFFMDYFHTYTNGALVMDCSGAELDAMKVAMPGYLAMSYHAGAAEAMLTGAIMGKPTAYRQDWAWAQVGTEKPAGYPAGAGPSLPAFELYPAFADAFVNACPADKDPFAPADPKWVGHLWKGHQYWIMTGGHEDLTSLPSGEVEVVLPELPGSLKEAFAFDMVSLHMKPVKIERNGNKISLRLQQPLSLVFFPAPDCPPLPLITVLQKPRKGQVLKVEVRLLAPWNNSLLNKAANNFQWKVPGFATRSRKIKADTYSFEVDIPADTEPNNYLMQAAGDCLPMRKWFTVE